jgi:hypothetical protein
MKARALLFVIVLLFAVSMLFAEDVISLDDIYGTWINADYNEKGIIAKVIINPENTSQWYKRVTDTTDPDYTATITFTDNWYDKDGNLWIKFTTVWSHKGNTSYWLSKLNESGTIWEKVSSGVDYPEELSPIAGTHSILYRQE